MRNIVITGATSFIGINLIKELLKTDSYKIYAVVRENSLKISMLPKDKRVIIVHADMSEYDQLPEKVSDNVYCFVQLAWNGTRAPNRDNVEIQRKNYEYSVKALNSAIKMNARVFLTAGSQAEYGPQAGLVTETTKANTQTEYGKFKLKFYNTAKELCKKHDIKFYEPRFFSLYGYGDYEKTLVISVLRKMLKNEKCDLTDCTQDWNFLHIRDAAHGMKMLIQNISIEDGIYNFGSINTRQLKEFVKEMKHISVSKSLLNFGAIAHNDSGKNGLKPCVSKLLSIGWHEQISFDDGIKELVEQLKDDHK